MDRLIEKGRTISAANETEIRAAVAALSAVLSRAFVGDDVASTGSNGSAKSPPVKEAAKIPPGPVPTIDDVRKSLQALIDLLSPLTVVAELPIHYLND